MEDLVIEKLNKTVGSGENGSNTAQAQADLIKLLSQSRASGLSNSGISQMGGLGALAAATQARQNGSQLIRSYEALLQRSPASRLPPPQAVTMPGPTRRKKKKRRRQPDMPKKACTPFMHFCAYFKRKLMEEGKEFPQFADFGKRAGELWRNMGDEEKKKFNELSELDRQRYIKDMKEYEERKLAEKERERELQQQREQELQVLREKEMERIQKQQRDQMEQQQKHMEQQKQQGSNPNLLNMMNPLTPLSPLMVAALNQSLMQTMMSNPELLKSMYSEAARNYYIETIKNIYQNACSNGSSPPTSSPSLSSMSGMDMHTNVSSAMGGSSPLANMGMNLNLLSLLSQSSQLSNLSGSHCQSPSPKAASPSRNNQSSPLSGLNSTALDLSANRSNEGRGSCSSDEDHSKEAEEDI